MVIFPTFFLGNIGQENVFYDILERENAFLGYKNKNFKKTKNWHFSQRVNPGFWSENGHFSNFLFRQYRPGKCVLQYSRTKNRLSRPKKKKIKQSKNWRFSKGVNPWFWSKNDHFSNFFFQAKKGEKKVFYDILKGKNAFLGYKNKKIKKSKKLTFFQRG